jgi:hypothetical protein
VNINHPQILAFLDIGNDGAFLACDGPEKHKNNFYFTHFFRVSVPYNDKYRVKSSNDQN